MFLVAVFLFMLVGYLIGSTVPLYVSTNKSRLNYAKIGVIAGIILFMPMAYGYTGKLPWEVFNTIKDQGSSYLEMQEYLKNKTIFRSIVSFVRILFSPFLYSIIPLFIIHWKNIDYKWKFLFLLYLLTVITFSLLRGTDKESADIAIMAMSGSLVIIGRNVYSNGIKIRIKKILIYIIFLFAIIGVLGGLFIERKLSRVGSLDGFCIYETNICSEYVNGFLSEKQYFAYAMLTAYLAQGYYGLSIALDKEFQPTIGDRALFFYVVII